jgi:hypothetical protein
VDGIIGSAIPGIYLPCGGCGGLGLVMVVVSFGAVVGAGSVLVSSSGSDADHRVTVVGGIVFVAVRDARLSSRRRSLSSGVKEPREVVEGMEITNVPPGATHISSGIVHHCTKALC